jgi:hypothetical protein
MMPPKPSKRVVELLSLGWTSACDGLAALQWFTMKRRPNEGTSRFLDIYAGERHVQIYISPTGRSVRVYVDGNEA